MRILLMYSTHQSTQGHLDRLQSLAPQLEVVVAQNESDAMEKSEKASIILGHRYLKQCLPFANNLLWIQSTAGGVDRLPQEELAEKGVILTNMTSAAETIARHAVTLAWSINRGLPNFWQQQKQGVWHQPHQWLPYPQKSLVFGMGSIGMAIAKILAAEGIEVNGVRRTPSIESIPPFKKVFYDGSWLDELSSIDWCFLALPNTPETQNLFDKRVLLHLPVHGIVINIGRGETLVTEDLCDLLSQGHLGGAALDVVFPKPKDSEDLVWKVPRLFITPHVASHSYERANDIERFCEQQVLNFLNNEPLSNVIKFLK
jgi:phosphoglycerate dehydrogenase-like enzyme